MFGIQTQFLCPIIMGRGSFFDSQSEDITGMVAEGDDVFISTISSLYKFENGSLNLLREISVSNEQDLVIPTNIQLYQNYPNPFNPSTTIRFTLSTRENVSLKIYDVLGNHVHTVVDQKILTAGEHTYTWAPEGDLSSGVYLYKLQTSKETGTKSMILIK